MNEAERVKAWQTALKATMDARSSHLWGQCQPYVERIASADKLQLLLKIVAECGDIGIIRLAAELGASEPAKPEKV